MIDLLLTIGNYEVLWDYCLEHDITMPGDLSILKSMDGRSRAGKFSYDRSGSSHSITFSGWHDTQLITSVSGRNHRHGLILSETKSYCSQSW